MVMLNEMKLPKRTIWIKHFEGIADLVKHINETETNTHAFKECSSKKGTYSFTKTQSFEEAQKLLLNGWSVGAEQLTKQLKIASNKVQQKEVQRAVYDVVGFQASVPRYVQGIPQNMVNKKMVKQKARVVTLVKDIGYNAGVTTEKIMEDSVKFIQIVQAVEKAGVRVNVEVYFHAVEEGHGTKEEIHIRLPIKRASERLNLSKMSYPLMHPSFLRRTIFKAMETETRLKKSGWSGGYGRPAYPNEREAVKKPGEYLIPVLIDMKTAENILNQVVTTK